MSKKNNIPAKKIPSEVIEITEAIRSGKLKNAKMSWKEDGSMNFTADSPNGESRIIMEKISTPGYHRESHEECNKLNATDRLNIVKQLHNEGFTQTEIAKRTLTSQKTVSNDLKKLRTETLGK